ncbi:hypothetical protein B0H17DRAFT_1130048 [Mycena rosella]|uniref:Uncharacterized protein n=1 Tax=Mycena rosella TaxID=1033263 RepID=A0AAD7DSI0_MYCRO|nr:hypothetical protein B0H17DRAFT_1130048 [Mycena rosella]
MLRKHRTAETSATPNLAPFSISQAQAGRGMSLCPSAQETRTPEHVKRERSAAAVDKRDLALEIAPTSMDLERKTCEGRVNDWFHVPGQGAVELSKRFVTGRGQGICRQIVVGDLPSCVAALCKNWATRPQTSDNPLVRQILHSEFEAELQKLRHSGLRSPPRSEGVEDEESRIAITVVVVIGVEWFKHEEGDCLDVGKEGRGLGVEQVEDGEHGVVALELHVESGESGQRAENWDDSVRCVAFVGASRERSDARRSLQE